MQVDITFLGEFMDGPRWQAQPQELNRSFGGTQALTRAAFVEAWNRETGLVYTEGDFEWVQRGGPPEDGQRGEATDG